MQVMPNQPSAKGPAEFFTGDVSFDAIARGEAPSRLSVSAIRFAPGARTAWHSHALGQTLYVTEGEGRVQARGGDVVSMHRGDVVYAPPDEWHWHGAAPHQHMVHISVIQGFGELQRPETEWGGHVSDKEYLGGAE